jgi:thiamine-phosphate pyrophosphorylase
MALKHQARASRKMLSAIRQVQGSEYAPDVPLLFPTDPQRTPDILGTTARLPRGSGVIFRHFGAAERVETAFALTELCYSRGLVCLIAADPALALHVGAHGVHWPEARLGEARRYRGMFTYQTASAHSRRAIWRAAKAGMDAALVSAVFPSNSPSAGRPIGAARFRHLAQTSPLSLYALGGVTPYTSGKIASFGGIAAIEGVLQSF